MARTLLSHAHKSKLDIWHCAGQEYYKCAQLIKSGIVERYLRQGRVPGDNERHLKDQP